MTVDAFEQVTHLWHHAGSPSRMPRFFGSAAHHSIARTPRSVANNKRPLPGLPSCASRQESVPDSVPDYVHLAAFWCSLVLEAKTLSQGASARCMFMHFGATVSAGF
jgi:hypothetical protein